MGARATAATAPQQSRMRADASRNRERIIAAARDVFVEWGPEAPLDEIARRAGVGNATVYRHFADRGALVHEVTMDSMRRVADEAETALVEEDDPFEGLTRFVLRAADERISSLCPLLAEGLDHRAAEVTATRHRLDATLERLMGRARAAGQLREDVEAGDLMVALAQLTRPLPGSRCDAAFDLFTRRHLQLFLDGLRTPARSTLPGSAATLEDLKRGDAPMR